MNESEQPILLTVLGKPVGKARARTVRTATGKSHTYTPEKTRNAEVAWQAAWLESRQESLGDGPIRVHVRAYFKPPKSHPWRWPAPVGRPEIDNIAKLVLDALRGFAYLDDSQVVQLLATKYYSGMPRTEVEIAKAWLKGEKC